MAPLIQHDKMTLLHQSHKLLASGNVDDALGLLRRIASPNDDASVQASYSRLANKLAKNIDSIPIIRITFLANATLNHWVDCLRFWLLLDGFKLEATIAPFGTWRQQVLDQNSILYKSKPDVVWLFLQPNDLGFDVELTLDSQTTSRIVEDSLADINHQIAMISQSLSSLLIVNNIPLPAYRVMGNYEGSTPQSLYATIQKFNLDMAAALPKSTLVFDIAHIAAVFGLSRWEDARMWHHSKHPFALDANGLVAFAAARLLVASRGRAKKCIVLDLDNTLWGGVVGDDGSEGIRIGVNGGAVGEAYYDFQKWLKALSERGILLAVCSKNNEDIAKECFLSKSDMPLQLDDFVAFKANWDNKADNIKAIAAELNVGLDSLVFVDDNPMERDFVRATLPQVTVPEIPADPANYISAIASGCWFETISISHEDRVRARSYKQNALLGQIQADSANLDNYLQSLEMVAEWGSVTAKTLLRTTQLINKTNQFHLTTTRYTEAQISEIISDPNKWIGYFKLRDKFVEYGIISIVIIDIKQGKAFIDTWTMSCRVFSRTMENFTFNILRKIAVEKGCRELIGVYIPTQKNAVVTDLYRELGGEKMDIQSNCSGQYWRFNLKQPQQSPSSCIKDITPQD